MPVMSGKAMATALRGSHPDTKILYTSGYSEEVIGRSRRSTAGHEFLQSPTWQLPWPAGSVRFWTARGSKRTDQLTKELLNPSTSEAFTVCVLNTALIFDFHDQVGGRRLFAV